VTSLSHIGRPLARLPRPSRPRREPPPTRPLRFVGPQLDWRARLLRLLAIATLTGIVVGIWSTQNATVETVTVPQTRILAPDPGRPTLDFALTSLDDGLALGAIVGKPIVPEALPRPPEPPDPSQPLRFDRFTVQSGDTLFDISAVYGVSIDDLLRFNPALGDGTRIDIGQIVRIPVFEE